MQAEDFLTGSDAVFMPVCFYTDQVVTQPYLQRTYGFSQNLYLPEWRFTRVAANIGADGGSLVSYGGDVTIDILAGVFAEDVQLVLSSASGMPGPVGLTSIGQVFDITTTYMTSGEPAQPQPGQTYNLSVQYTDPVPALEETLALYTWDNGHWVLSPTSASNPATSTITAMPDHFSV
mgnify:CR=1 FL=1